MAFCRSCGQQTEAVGDVCPACSMYAPATSSVGTHSGSVSRASYAAASDYRAPPPDHYSAAALYARADRYWPTEPDLYFQANSDRRLLFEPPEVSALPQLERTYPDESGRSPLAPSPPAGADLAARRPEQPWRLEPGRGGGNLSALPARPAELPRNGRWIALVAATAVVLAAAAAAAILVVQHSRAGHSPRNDKRSAAAMHASSASASVAPTGQNQLSVEPTAATAPHEAAIVAFVERYFDAINHHDYLGYKRLFTLALRGGLSAASFTAEFGTTRDSAELLHSIDVIGAGRVDALVTFTSHPLAAGRPTNLACTGWSIEFYLVRRGSRYLLASPPLWYQASYHSCS